MIRSVRALALAMLFGLLGAMGCASDSWNWTPARKSDSWYINQRIKHGYGLGPDYGGGWNAIERMTPPRLTN
jgi:hypothetical protein